MINYLPGVMMWLAAESKWAYTIPYYNSSICYRHHFEYLFLLDQINFNVYILNAFPAGAWTENEFT